MVFYWSYYLYHYYYEFITTTSACVILPFLYLLVKSIYLYS